MSGFPADYIRYTAQGTCFRGWKFVIPGVSRGGSSKYPGARYSRVLGHLGPKYSRVRKCYEYLLRVLVPVTRMTRRVCTREYPFFVYLKGVQLYMKDETELNLPLNLPFTTTAVYQYEAGTRTMDRSP